MSNYFYLEISLELDPDDACDIEVVFLKKHILDSLNKLFGEVGTSIPVDVLKFVKTKRLFILRVPSAYYVKLYSALTLSGTYNGYDCFYKVHRTTPCLISLNTDSRSYEF